MRKRHKNGNGGEKRLGIAPSAVSSALVNAIASRVERAERDVRDARTAEIAGDKVRAMCAWQRVASLLLEVEDIRAALRKLGIDPGTVEGVVGTRATHLIDLVAGVKKTA